MLNRLRFTFAKSVPNSLNHICSFKSIFIPSNPYLYLQIHIYTFKSIFIPSNLYLYLQIHIYTFKSIFIHICRTTSMYCYLYSICYIFCVCLWNNRDVLKRFSKERKRMNQNKLNEAKKNISKNKQTKAKKKKKKQTKAEIKNKTEQMHAI